MMLADELTATEVDEAVAELSAAFGWDYSETWEAVRARAQGERDPGSLALAAAGLYQDALGEGQELGLASDGSPKPYGDVEYADPEGGKYPIDTEEHARAAWSYINQEDNAAKYGSGKLAKVRARIKAACRRFGIEVSDDDEDQDQDSDSDVAASAGWYSRDGYEGGQYVGHGEVALSYPAEPWTYDFAAEAASAVAPEVLRLTAAHPGFFPAEDVAQAWGYLALGHAGELTGDDAYRTVEQAHVGSEVERLSMMNDDRNGMGRLPNGIARIHDSDQGQPHSSNHHAGCSSACSRDHAQPADGGTVHPEVSRLLDVMARKMGNRERPHGNSTVHRPMSATELRAAQRAARPGHT